jgi:hypothetical protein
MNPARPTGMAREPMKKTLLFAALSAALLGLARSAWSQTGGARTGSLSVQTDPAGALITLGTHGIAKSPAQFEDLPPGRYKLHIQLKGYRTMTELVDVQPGHTATFNFALRPEGQPDTVSGLPRATVLQQGQTLGAWPSLAEALRHAPDDSLIELSPGTYECPAEWTKPIRVVGRGGRDNVILALPGRRPLEFKAARAGLEGLTLQPESEGGLALVIVSAADVSLRDCALTAKSSSVLRMDGAGFSVRLEQCRLDGATGSGLLIRNHARAELRDCDVENHGGPGLEVRDGAEVTAMNSRILDNGQAGLLVHAGGRVRLESCEVAFNHRAGVEVRDGGRAELDASRLTRGHGGGLFVHDGGHATARACVVTGHRLAGLEARDGGEILAEECQLRDGAANGVLAHDGGRVTFRGGRIERHQLAGVEVRTGGAIELYRAAVHRNLGSGLLAHRDGQARIEQCDFALNQQAGIEIATGSNPRVSGCRIRQGFSGGILIHSEGRGVIQNCLISANRLNGVEVRDAAEPRVIHCRIERSGFFAVRAHRFGFGEIKDCDLRNNRRGAWRVERGSPIRRDGNRT